MCRRFTACLLLFGLFQTVFAFEDELRFAEALTAEGFPDLAQTVLTRTLRQFPEAEASATELRIRILIAEKKFAEAQPLIAAVNDPAPLWLFLAETANRAQQFPAAEAAYKTYFESAPATSDAAFEAAFNYGRRLEERGAIQPARALYEQVLKAPNSARSARPLKLNLAKLLTEENPDRAKKLCEEVQLGGLDLWFGEAVIIWADVMIRTNDWNEAQSILETQMETLHQISTSVPSAVAPVAGARYLLGACYEHAGKKAEALTQFYNVYAKHGDSAWGPQAHERAQALIAEFEQQGRTVKIDLGTHRAKIEETAFGVARRLFFEKQYAAAVPAYLDALHQFPEVEESVPALRDLILCSIDLNDPLTAKTVAAYLGERFAKRDSAADALLAAGKCAFDAKQPELAEWIYDRYFASFPQHARAPGVLYSLATLKTGAEQDDALRRILSNWPDSPYALRALSRLAWNAYEQKNYTTAAAQFEEVLRSETDPEKQTRARFALAESYRLSNDWNAALKQFQTLENTLNQVANGYGASRKTLAFNYPFIEKSLFYQGLCLDSLGEKEDAVNTLDRFIARFQGSEWIPKAQIAKASALLDLNRSADALAALAFLNESREPLPLDVKFLLGRAYAAAGQHENAVRELSDVLNFSSDNLLLTRAGLELGRAQTDPAEKLASFQRVALLADPDDPAQAALIAAALFESLPLYLELNRPQDVLTDSTRLTTDFPTFGKTNEMNQLRESAETMLEKEKGETANEHE